MSVCKYCGCFDENACDGGCYWLDPEQTICSQCVRLMNGDELELLFTAEMTRYARRPVVLEMEAGDMFVWIAATQLALRHPSLQEEQPLTYASLRRFIEFLQSSAYADVPGAQEMIRRGFDPAFDDLLAGQPVPFPSRPKREPHR